MNSLEYRRLNNLKITKKNLDQALKFYTLVEDKVYKIFDSYCKAKGIVEGVIDDIYIEDDGIRILYTHNYDADHDYMVFSKSLLTLKTEDIKWT